MSLDVGRLAYSLLALSTLATGCARPASTPTATPASAQRPPPAPIAQPTPTQPPPPAIHRLDAGAWPGSNVHRWGDRGYELRQTAAGIEVRLHDAIDFQGVGMTPEQMSATRHSCTAWELLPASIAIPAAKSCDAAKATCDAIRAFYTITTRAPTGDSLSVHPAGEYYGRNIGSCGQ